MKRLAHVYKRFCEIELAVARSYCSARLYPDIRCHFTYHRLSDQLGSGHCIANVTWSVYIGADTALRDDKMVDVRCFRNI